MKIKQKGFTLIEVLISTTIFAFIAVISYSAINTVIKSQDIQKPHNENLIQLQKTLNYIERDITQTYNQSITLAKAGLIIKSLQNNKLLNISYHVSSEDQLIRKDLDEKISLTLINNIKKAKIRVLDKDNNWKIRWEKSSGNYIKAVEIKFEHPFWGVIKKLVFIDV